MTQRTIFLEDDVMDKLALIKLNVSSFAFENIKNELMEMKAAEEKPDHVSHVRPGESCLCKLRKNFRLPCRHVLAVSFVENKVPLDIVHERWRITYVKGTGKKLIYKLN